MPPKLTILIPCKNEASNILACIESVRGIAGEILVADSLSTDNTLDIVRQTGACRIIEREFVDYASFKNWAIPQARHPWILVVDADERVTEELAAEIRGVLARDDPSLDAYRMRFEVFFLGYPIRHCGWNRSTTIRLFRRDACRYGAPRIHERLEVAPGRVGTLRGKFLHYTCRSLSQWTNKQDRYATLWAEDRHAAGRRTSWLGILMRPPLRFLQLYIFRGGFLDGTAGLIVCLSYAFYTFLKYANLWQLNRVPTTREVPVPFFVPHGENERMMTGVLAVLAACLCFVLYLIVEYSFLVPAPRGLRILMYHKVSEDQADALTVKRAMLERHFDYLVAKRYTTVSFAEVLDGMRAGIALPPRSVVITFDDGFRDTYTVAFPLLKQYNLKATVFLVAGCIGKTSTWDATHEPLAGTSEIRELAASGLVEFGLHSYEHANYKHLTSDQIREDVMRSMRTLNELGIPFVPVLSFPYGAFPREANANAAMRQVLEDVGILLAVRIGQRVNPLPIRNPYELKRAIVNGNDRMFEFRIKLKKGRRKLFA